MGSHVNVWYCVVWEYTVLLCKKGQMVTLQRVVCIGEDSECDFKMIVCIGEDSECDFKMIGEHNDNPDVSIIITKRKII
jgi:hypothetical protein